MCIRDSTTTTPSPPITCSCKLLQSILPRFFLNCTSTLEIAKNYKLKGNKGADKTQSDGIKGEETGKLSTV